MSVKGKEQHKETLADTIADLQAEGFRVIDLEDKSPDAIAVRVKDIEYGLDGVVEDINFEIVAVEVLGKTYRPKRGWHGAWTHAAKRRAYHMFDRVIIRTFKRDTQYQKGGKEYPLVVE